MPEGPLKTEVFGGVAAWTLVAWAVAWLDGKLYHRSKALRDYLMEDNLPEMTASRSAVTLSNREDMVTPC